MTIRRLAWVLPLILIGWVTVMAGVMRVSDVAPGSVVLFPSQALLADLPEGAAILGLNRFALTLANQAGLTNALYGRGALLVLPAGLKGCLPLTQAQRKKL